MMTNEMKALMTRYLKGYAWLLIHTEATSEETEKVRVKLGELEDQLRTMGMTGEQMVDILERAEKFVSTPVEDLNEAQQQIKAELTFGKVKVDSKTMTKKEHREYWDKLPDAKEKAQARDEMYKILRT